MYKKTRLPSKQYKADAVISSLTFNSYHDENRGVDRGRRSRREGSNERNDRRYYSTCYRSS
eukprot:scaffold79008_cov23-Cyclotella_meneghiniana.AAC.2